MNYYNAADTSMQSLVRFNEVAGQIQWIWSFDLVFLAMDFRRIYVYNTSKRVA